MEIKILSIHTSHNMHRPRDPSHKDILPELPTTQDIITITDFCIYMTRLAWEKLASHNVIHTVQERIKQIF